MWKKFGINCILISILSVVSLIGLALYFDPFFHYHMPFHDGKAVQTRSAYQNPGIAKNAVYDTVITGSSLTENFRISWFNEAFGCNAVKLPFGSGRTSNYKLLFHNIFSSSNEIQNVFYGLDIFSLVCDADETIQYIPEYLYDNDWTNDMSYLLNKDVLMLDMLNMLTLSVNYDEDKAYTWDESFEFGEEIAVIHYLRNVYRLIQANEEQVEKDTFIEQCKDNLNNIVPFIENHPDTTFYIFYPPYSILYWDNTNRKGVTDAWIYAEIYATEQLLRYENVKLYNFQNVEWIVTDLNHYKDYMHYSGDINKYMTEAMSRGENLITKENYMDEFNKLYDIINGYDYTGMIEKYIAIAWKKMYNLP